MPDTTDQYKLGYEAAIQDARKRVWQVLSNSSSYRVYDQIDAALAAMVEGSDA